jgi:ATP-dependent Clp protease ATP-binding subunit ClpA
MMFERFTESARMAVRQAHLEAAGLGHERIGPEHLLIAVACQEGAASAALRTAGTTPEALREAVAREAPPVLDADALASLGIDLAEVRRRVEAAFGPGALERGRRCDRSSPPFGPDAKKALELALRYAVKQGDRGIGAEHVLFGVLRTESRPTVAALAAAGTTPDAVRAALSA